MAEATVHRVYHDNAMEPEHLTTDECMYELEIRNAQQSLKGKREISLWLREQITNENNGISAKHCMVRPRDRQPKTSIIV